MLRMRFVEPNLFCFLYNDFIISDRYLLTNHRLSEIRTDPSRGA